MSEDREEERRQSRRGPEIKVQAGAVAGKGSQRESSKSNEGRRRKRKGRAERRRMSEQAEDEMQRIPPDD